MRPPLWLATVGALLFVGAFGALAVLLVRTLHTPELAAVTVSSYAVAAVVLGTLGLSASVGLALWLFGQASHALQAQVALHPRIDTPPCPLCGHRGRL